MKRIIFLALILLLLTGVTGCKEDAMDNKEKEVLMIEDASSNMKLYLLDKYGIEAEIEHVSRETDGMVETGWYLGNAVYGEENFYVRADQYGENYNDSRYVSYYGELLQEEMEKQVHRIWPDAVCETHMDLIHKVPENSWGKDSTLKNFLKIEEPEVSIRLTIPADRVEKGQEAGKIQTLMKENADASLYGHYVVKYVDESGNQLGKYIVYRFADEPVPALDEIGETYHE